MIITYADDILISRDGRERFPGTRDDMVTHAVLSDEISTSVMRLPSADTAICLTLRHTASRMRMTMEQLPRLPDGYEPANSFSRLLSRMRDCSNGRGRRSLL